MPEWVVPVGFCLILLGIAGLAWHAARKSLTSAAHEQYRGPVPTYITKPSPLGIAWRNHND